MVFSFQGLAQRLESQEPRAHLGVFCLPRDAVWSPVIAGMENLDLPNGSGCQMGTWL